MNFSLIETILLAAPYNVAASERKVKYIKATNNKKERRVHYTFRNM